MNPDVTKTYIRGGHRVKDKGDGFKEILIFNGELSKEDKETSIMERERLCCFVSMVFLIIYNPEGEAKIRLSFRVFVT